MRYMLPLRTTCFGRQVACVSLADIVRKVSGETPDKELSEDLRIATEHVKNPAMSRMSGSISKEHFDDLKRDGITKGLAVSKSLGILLKTISEVRMKTLTALEIKSVDGGFLEALGALIFVFTLPLILKENKEKYAQIGQDWSQQYFDNHFPYNPNSNECYGPGC